MTHLITCGLSSLLLYRGRGHSWQNVVYHTGFGSRKVGAEIHLFMPVESVLVIIEKGFWWGAVIKTFVEADR